MGDRIEALERLTRLRDAGALTEEEFQLRKRRLPGRRATWLGVAIVAVVGVMALIATLFFLLPSRSNPPPAANESAGAGQPAQAPPPPVAAPPAVPPLDISSPLRIVDGDCRFAPDLEQAFADLLHRDGANIRPREIRFGAMRLIPILTSRQEEGVERTDFRAYQSIVSLSEPVTWNGLRLIRLRAETGWEWGSSTMEFADDPARVRSALRRMGISVPESGRLDLPAEACASSLLVTARGTGTELTCSAGC